MMNEKRWTGALVLAVLSGFLAAAPRPASANPVPTVCGSFQSSLPQTYDLPDNIGPEGITRKGVSAEFFVGGLGDGGIYQFNAITGEGAYVVAPLEGREIVGLDYDLRSGLLYAAGGQSGTIYVFRPATGELVHTFEVAVDGGPTLVNDVKVTAREILVTDSLRPVFYRIPLRRFGRLASAPVVDTIALSGDYQFIVDPNAQPLGFAINSNGIEANFFGGSFITVNTTTGALYNVDSDSGVATQIEVDESFPFGDGILLVGNRLFVVQNFLNQVAQLKLSSDGASATLERVLTDPNFDVPSTTALFGTNLLSVNARFATPDAVDFQVVRTSLL